MVSGHSRWSLVECTAPERHFELLPGEMGGSSK